jgi:GntR family transcriptional regulator
MQIEIDGESGVPIYMQLVDRIRQMVARGELQPGQQLPTMRQLAADLRINYNTVGRAYMILDQEGIISTQQGRGTYIASRLTDEEVKHLRTAKLRDMLGRVLREAVALGYGESEITQAFQDQLEAVVVEQAATTQPRG